MIELRGVCVDVEDLSTPQRATRSLLSAVDLLLTEGRVALIGANGSGKSTLLKLLNGLVLATSGTVLIDGLDPAKQGKAVRRKVGYIFTDPLAQLVMTTPADDIELSLRATIKDKAARRARALELLAGLGLASLAHQSIYDLSGGERQLVSLATVLAVDPAIVVADEPTTLLDLRNRHMLLRAFDQLDQQLIISTHDLDLASQCDRVLMLDGGSVVADGAPHEVIQHYRGQMA